MKRVSRGDGNVSTDNSAPPPLGRVGKCHRLRAAVLVQHDYPVQATRELHSHWWFHLTLVQRGYYLRQHKKREEIFTPGALSLIRNEEEHTDHHPPGSRCLHIAVLHRARYRLPVAENAGPHCVSPLLAAGFCAGLQHEFQHFDSDSELIVDLLLADLLSAHSALRDERSRFKPRWLGQLLDYIDDMFTEPWNLDDLASQVGVHPVYLCRSFRQHFHFTLGQYIRSLRVLRARQLVEERSTSLAEVAALAGFADQSHLQREFKKSVGISPGIYRRLNGLARS